MLGLEIKRDRAGEELTDILCAMSVLTDNSDRLHMVRKWIGGSETSRNTDGNSGLLITRRTLNAFLRSRGNVAVYTGIFPIARDEAGLRLS